MEGSYCIAVRITCRSSCVQCCDLLLLSNCQNHFAVTAYEPDSDEVVSHIPREIAHWSAVFLDCGGLIEGSITGVRRHSREA